jgi:hypothetical protein
MNLVCPILDDFQGWGFRPVFEFAPWISIHRVRCIEAIDAGQNPQPSKTEGRATSATGPYNQFSSNGIHW